MFKYKHIRTTQSIQYMMLNWRNKPKGCRGSIRKI